jgi:hypothetical protein
LNRANERRAAPASLKRERHAEAGTWFCVVSGASNVPPQRAVDPVTGPERSRRVNGAALDVSNLGLDQLDSRYDIDAVAAPFGRHSH